MIQVKIRSNVNPQIVSAAPSDTPMEILRKAGFDPENKRMSFNGYPLNATEVNSSLESLGAHAGDSCTISLIVKLDGAATK